MLHSGTSLPVIMLLVQQSLCNHERLELGLNLQTEVDYLGTHIRMVTDRLPAR